MKQATIEELAKMKNVKFKVTPEQSKKFQEEFFKQGGMWIDRTQKLSMVYSSCLVINKYGFLSHSGEDYLYKDRGEETIEIIDAPSLEEQYENDSALIDDPWIVWQYKSASDAWINCIKQPVFNIEGCRRHPHADIMIEYELASDEKKAALQCLNPNITIWVNCTNPNFHTYVQYRFDPEYKATTPDDVREIFKETDYDVFSNHAILSQKLRQTIDEHVQQDDLVKKEAVEVIIGDIVRIVQSDDDCTADWLDIANIARLMAKS